MVTQLATERTAIGSPDFEIQDAMTPCKTVRYGQGNEPLTNATARRDWSKASSACDRELTRLKLNPTWKEQSGVQTALPRVGRNESQPGRNPPPPYSHTLFENNGLKTVHTVKKKSNISHQTVKLAGAWRQGDGSLESITRQSSWFRL